MSNQNNSFLQDLIRRAKSVRNVLFGATLLSGIVTITGVYVAISGHIAEGTTISKVGIMSTVELTKRVKDENDRLDQALKDAMEENQRRTLPPS
ncbi:hypothetical protein [Mastigocladopsis repens]|uniref:hypothetical protein n=1 Tax=Mastigocladopsis repens TaxID=221287 RepID=UPI0002FB7AA4|nr:hypothetical protein [Mastigocladopsis repens]